MSGSTGGTTIMREFLVSLGFKVDKTSTENFNKTLIDATKTVVAMAAAAEAAAAAVFAATLKMSEGLERLYFASQRTGASADSFRAIGYAASQMGSSVQEAAATLENLAQRIRTNPGYASLANNLLGGKANLQDASALQQQLAEKFKTMPYYLANVYAQAFGISETSLRAMIAGLGEFSNEYRNKLKIFGVSNDAAALSGRRFMIGVRQVQSSVEILATKIGAPIADKLSVTLRSIDNFLVRNGEEIARRITQGINFVLKLADIVTQVIMRLSEAVLSIRDWFNNLSPSTQDLIEKFGLLVVAWRLLNTAFLASPIGLILSFVAALALLWDDYQTWKRGGTSLIDWTKWEPGIKKGLKALEDMRDWFMSLDISANQLQKTFEIFLAFIAGRWALGVVGAIGRVGVALGGLAAPTWFIALMSRLAGPAALLWPTNKTPTTAEEMQQLHEALANPASVTADRDLPPEARAFLDTIAGPESNGRYNVRYSPDGDKTFDDLSKHPRIYEQGPSGPSSAAGRYQITASTYDDFAPGAGIGDMLPSSQDRLGWIIASKRYADATGRSLLADLKNPAMHPQIEKALRGTWSTINLKTFPSMMSLEGARDAAGASVNGAGQSMAREPGGTSVDEQLFQDAMDQARLRYPGGANGGAVINQTTTINVDGARDPVATAGAVADAQRGVNNSLQRNTQGAIR